MTGSPRRRLLRVLLRSAAVLLLLALAAVLVPLRHVRGDEMAPSIRDGDWVWVLPLAPLRGDVVALADPLDPSRTVLRRAIQDGVDDPKAKTPTKVKFEDGSMRVKGKRIRQKELGTLGTAETGGFKVFKETIWSKPPARATAWLIQRRLDKPVKWDDEPCELPVGTWYLAADDRDRAVDSRWWGPVPADRIEGVVRARYGPADDWRPSFEFLSGTE